MEWEDRPLPAGGNHGQIQAQAPKSGHNEGGECVELHQVLQVDNERGADLGENSLPFQEVNELGPDLSDYGPGNEASMKVRVHYTVHTKSERVAKSTCFATPPNPEGLIKWLANQDWPEWTYASWHMGDRSGMIWRNPGPGVVALATGGTKDGKGDLEILGGRRFVHEAHAQGSGSDVRSHPTRTAADVGHSGQKQD